MPKENQLNTPTKRIGVLVLAGGIVFFIIGFAQFLGRYSPLEASMRVFLLGPFWALRGLGDNSEALGGFLLWFGALSTVGGLLASYLYDSTLGRVTHWVRTGSFAPTVKVPANDTVSERPVARPAKPRSAILEWLGVAIIVLFQNWLTVLMGFVTGIAYLEGKKSEILLAPAGIAIFFWLQALFRTSSDQRLSIGSTFLFLAIKLSIAYLFFGVGMLIRAMELVR